MSFAKDAPGRTENGIFTYSGSVQEHHWISQQAWCKRALDIWEVRIYKATRRAISSDAFTHDGSHFYHLSPSPILRFSVAVPPPPPPYRVRSNTTPASTPRPSGNRFHTTGTRFRAFLPSSTTSVLWTSWTITRNRALRASWTITRNNRVKQTPNFGRCVVEVIVRHVNGALREMGAVATCWTIIPQGKNGPNAVRTLTLTTPKRGVALRSAAAKTKVEAFGVLAGASRGEHRSLQSIHSALCPRTRCY